MLCCVTVCESRSNFAVRDVSWLFYSMWSWAICEQDGESEEGFMTRRTKALFSLARNSRPQEEHCVTTQITVARETKCRDHG